MKYSVRANYSEMQYSSVLQESGQNVNKHVNTVR